MKPGRDVHLVARREAERALDVRHLLMQRRADVADVLQSPDDGHDVDRPSARAGTPRRGAGHLGDALEERVDRFSGPVHRPLGMEQHRVAAEGPVDRVVHRRLSAVVRNQVVPQPEAGRGGDDLVRRPAGHPWRDPGRELLVHHPVEAELRMIGANERRGPLIHGTAQALLVLRWKVDLPQPEVAANDRQIAQEGHSAQQGQAREQDPPVHETEDPHQKGAGAGWLEGPGHRVLQ